MSDDDIVEMLRECAEDSRKSEGDYYADQYATDASVFDDAADEIEQLRTALAKMADQDVTRRVTNGNIFIGVDPPPIVRLPRRGRSRFGGLYGDGWTHGFAEAMHLVELAISASGVKWETASE